MDTFKKLVPGLIFLFSFTIIHFSAAQIPDSAQSHVADSTVTIGSFVIIGNKLTKPHIITRELTFHEHDNISMGDLEKKAKRSEENLLNTSLFNSAHISWLKQQDNTVAVYIILTERWYIFPLPIFEIVDRNFNVWWETKDFSRIVYGGAVTLNNFRGRNETLGMALRFGYTQRINLSYSIPYINGRQRSGLNFGFAYSRNHQTAIETYHNKIVYYNDDINFSRSQISGNIEYTYRHGFYDTHYLSAGFYNATVKDSVAKLNPDFFGNGKTSQRLISLRYLYKSEHRDIVAYPLHGYEYDIEFVKNGLSFLNDDADFSYATATVRKYWQLLPKWFFSSFVRGKLSDGNFQPYYNTGALGYNSSYVRGYEYYVADGQDFFLLKTNLKFQLLKKHEVHAGFIPLEKFATIPFAFYINFYGDAGYANDRQFAKYNNLSNSWLIGYGAGIDFVTYYDMVFRFEYSINKFGESGLFLHFSAPI